VLDLATPPGLEEGMDDADALGDEFRVGAKLSENLA
jgi:hypothetical protein